MANKQRKVLEELLSLPPPTNLRWSDVVSCLKALGANVSQGSGSRIRVELNGVRNVFHEPHDNSCGKGRAKDVRTFLQNAEVTKDDV